MKFYAGPKFLFLNMMDFGTCDVNNIMNTLFATMNIDPSLIPDTNRGILIVFTMQTVVSTS